MKTIVLIIINLFFVINTLLANDAGVVYSLGGVEYIKDGKIKDISLDNEEIYITFKNDSIDYKIIFNFINNGLENEVDVGFPVYLFNDYKGNKVTNNDFLFKFTTKVNDKNVPFEYVKESKEKNISSWYLKKVKFKSMESTIIEVDYSSVYASASYGFYAGYFYGSAHTWNGLIKTIKLIIRNESNKYIYRFDNRNNSIESDFLISGNNQTTVTYKNIKPNKDDSFGFYLLRNSFIGIDFYEGNKKLEKDVIRENDIIFYTRDQLSLLRNMIFAENGYIFSSNKLTNFFTNEYLNKGQYKPTSHNVDKNLNKIEKESINVILALEGKRNK